MEWFYADSDAAAGPVSKDDLMSMLRARSISGQTLVWREGMDAWTPLAEVETLADLMKVVPPPLPTRAPDVPATSPDDFFASLGRPPAAASPARSAEVWSLPRSALAGAVFGVAFAVLQQAMAYAPVPAERFVGQVIGAAIGGALLFSFIARVRNWAGRGRSSQAWE